MIPCYLVLLVDCKNAFVGLEIMGLVYMHLTRETKIVMGLRNYKEFGKLTCFYAVHIVILNIDQKRNGATFLCVSYCNSP